MSVGDKQELVEIKSDDGRMRSHVNFSKGTIRISKRYNTRKPQKEREGGKNIHTIFKGSQVLHRIILYRHRRGAIKEKRQELWSMFLTN